MSFSGKCARPASPQAKFHKSAVIRSKTKNEGTMLHAQRCSRIRETPRSQHFHLSWPVSGLTRQTALPSHARNTVVLQRRPIWQCHMLAYRCGGSTRGLTFEGDASCFPFNRMPEWHASTRTRQVYVLLRCQVNVTTSHRLSSQSNMVVSCMQQICNTALPYCRGLDR